MNGTIVLSSAIQSSANVTFSISDWILIATLILTIVLHIFLAVWDDSRKRFDRFDKMTRRIIDTGISIKSFTPTQVALWDSAILADCEYLSFLVRKNKVSFNDVKEYLGPCMKDYYEECLCKRNPDKEKDPAKFEEFKWLYGRL